MLKRKIVILSFFLFCGFGLVSAQQKATKALVLTERGGQHEGFVSATLRWLQPFATENHIELTVINNTESINETYLANFQLFIQLNYPPYNWTDSAKLAFEEYIDEGKGGWVGFHHATLLGEFDGFHLWQWFSDFMGEIRFKNYVANRASGKVYVESKNHPVMKGLPKSFIIPDDEWYTFDKNPRPNVKVLANVDEASYQPPTDIKMGDHPVIWVNPNKKARNVYFLMGHSASLLKSEEFKKMFANAILWASKNR
ncbi:MAG TPA: ThuA domain-containing protein [Pelobium sp.]|nr:ThuA domain-containing protein [Pelobium sp.]